MLGERRKLGGGGAGLSIGADGLPEDNGLHQRDALRDRRRHGLAQRRQGGGEIPRQDGLRQELGGHQRDQGLDAIAEGAGLLGGGDGLLGGPQVQRTRGDRD